MRRRRRHRVDSIVDGVSENYRLDVSRAIQYICHKSELRTMVMVLEDLLEEETKLPIINTLGVRVLDSL